MGYVASPRAIFFSIICLLLIVIGVQWFIAEERKGNTVTIAGSVFRTEIVRDPVGQMKGLSQRQSIDRDQAFIMEFSDDAPQKIWMRDMQFSIDAVWLDKSSKVVMTKQNIAPASYPRLYGPNMPVRYIIQLHANTKEVSQLKIGDVVEIP